MYMINHEKERRTHAQGFACRQLAPRKEVFRAVPVGDIAGDRDDREDLRSVPSIAGRTMLKIKVVPCEVMTRTLVNASI